MVKKLLAAGMLGLGGMAQQRNVEIEFWTYYLSPNFDGYIKGVIADFEKANPTIKVKWVDKQDTMERDLTASIALGKAPDVVNLWQDSTFAGAQNGILLPITQVVPRGLLDQLYYPNVLDIFTVEGQVYGLPWYGWLDQGVMMYNPDLFAKAGVDIRNIKNTDDLLAVSEKTRRSKRLPEPMAGCPRSRTPTVRASWAASSSRASPSTPKTARPTSTLRLMWPSCKST